MKLNITTKQFGKLSEADLHIVYDFDPGLRGIPAELHIDIGWMIDFLCDYISSIHFEKNRHSVIGGGKHRCLMMEATELCDALWSACLEKFKR